MSSSQKRRLTVAQLMAINAGLALFLGLTQLSPSDTVLLSRLLLCVWSLFLLALLVNAQLDVLTGSVCPHCERKTLRRRATRLLAMQYYQCTTCGARWKRRWPFAAWQGASGPDDAAVLRRRTSGGRWSGYARSETDDSTCGSLLQSKRQRTELSAKKESREPE